MKRILTVGSYIKIIDVGSAIIEVNKLKRDIYYIPSGDKTRVYFHDATTDKRLDKSNGDGYLVTELLNGDNGDTPFGSFVVLAAYLDDNTGINTTNIASSIENPIIAQLVASGDAPLVTQDFMLNVMMGNVDGYSAIDKFGENPDIDTSTDPEDVVEHGGVYNWSPDGVADIISISSSDASDTQTIIYKGLTADGTFVVDSVTLQGQTRVSLPTPLWRIITAQNDSIDSITGTAYFYKTTNETNGVPTIADIKGIISNGNNRTLLGVYTIPKGKVGFLLRGELGISKGGSDASAICSYYSRRFGKGFTIKKRVNITTNGSSIYQDLRSFPDIIPSLTDIKLTIEEVSANNVGVFGTFDILLVDETKFSNAYLNSIGQPGF